MKNIYALLLIIGIIALSFSCQKEEEKPEVELPQEEDTVLDLYSFTGKAQKGPFITGTTINLYELNANLGQTGKSFTSTITSDDGSFSFNNIELNSDLVLITANGFYFSEIYGMLSDAQLSLHTLTDISDKESININVLTHIIKGRIENLVADGMSFQNANEQAKTEIMTFLGVTEDFGPDFEDLDISINDENNAILLAFSIILQKWAYIWYEIPPFTAELSQLLSHLSNDFSADGNIENQQLIDTLLYNISQLNLNDVRSRIEKRYSNLGMNVTIPDFEKYITKFQEKHSTYIVPDIIYPDSAAPDYHFQNDPGAHTPNLLNFSDSIFGTYRDYAVAAITPLHTSLEVKFKTSSQYYIGGMEHGWEYISDSLGGFTLKSAFENSLMAFPVGFMETGTAVIEFYENGEEQPSRIKNISWK